MIALQFYSRQLFRQRRRTYTAHVARQIPKGKERRELLQFSDVLRITALARVTGFTTLGGGDPGSHIEVEKRSSEWSLTNMIFVGFLRQIGQWGREYNGVNVEATY